ncbi:MAG: LCP family protein [Eubacteriales bacterium]|nr:LCP family protein [Eubacteriales bacterium]
MRRARSKSTARNTGKPMRTHPVKKVKKKRSFGAVLKWIIGIFITLVVGVFVMLGFGFVDESDLLAPIDSESGKINALLLGVDQEGLRSDTIMVASFDLETAELNLLSIPRDTKVYVKNRSMTRKMTEVHSLPTKKGDGTIVGPIGMAEAVTQLTGIPINYYVEFSFDAAENLLNTLGKITYDVPDVEGGGRGMNYEDPVQDLYIHLKPGVQKLNGEQVLQLMRYRKGDSDHARSERQQNVIKAIIEQKLGLSLIWKLPKIFTQIKTELTTNISATDVAKYANYLGSLSTEKVHTYQLPGSDQRQNGKWYYVCDMEETKAMINEDFGIETDNMTTRIEVYGEGSNTRANIIRQ